MSNPAFIGSVLLGFAAAASAAAESPGHWRVYIGTYTHGESEGVYLLQLDAATGALSEPTLAAEAVNPSFLALHPALPRLYSTGDYSGAHGIAAGGVTAFAIDPGSGALESLGHASSGGNGACHVAVAPDGRHLAVANYSSGSVALLPLDDDGVPGEPVSVAEHEGFSVHPQRQRGPHAHSVTFDADGRFLFVSDLGIDQVLIYRYDPDAGALTPNDPPFIELEPGAGPRHFAFHPSGRFAFSINELDNTITSFDYDAAQGRLDTVQTVGTLPGDFDGSNTTAEIRVHPNGRFVYGSNRGHDSIAAFRLDGVRGRLHAIGHASTEGRTPRNFNLDPEGRFLLAANQQSGNVVTLAIDPETGALAPTGHEALVPAPVCVVFTRPPE